jgi:carboxylate-amine ligase
MSRHPLHFGIEEEYFLTDLNSRQMLAQPSAELLRECQEVVGGGFAFEMFQGQIEVASPVFTTTGEASEFFSSIRRQLSQALARHGAGLLCAGSHPLACWREQRPTQQAHFLQLFEEFQSVARRSVMSGLHVHVEIPREIDRIAVMNEVSPWLPLLLLLSCSSPFWQGENSGFMSYRQVVCDGWPRMGTPEHFRNEDEYQSYLALLQRIGTIEKGGNGWWGIRPAARFPTLELRITDACPRLQDTLLLATLFRVMVNHAVVAPRPGIHFSATSQRLLKENRWQAKRHGLEGHFVVNEQGAVMDARQWLALARSVFEQTAEDLGEPQLFDQAEALLAAGTSATRQLACFNRAVDAGQEPGRAVHQVVDLLLNETRSEK